MGGQVILTFYCLTLIGRLSLVCTLFTTIISIFPEAFKLQLNKNVLNINFQGGAKPSDVKERKVVLKSLLNKIENENARYIDLVELPEIRRERYKSAKETILDNIIKFAKNAKIGKNGEFQHEKKIAKNGNCQ